MQLAVADPAELVTCDQTIERAFNGFKHWRGLATRYDKHAIVYRGGVVLAAVLLWLTDLKGLGCLVEDARAGLELGCLVGKDRGHANRPSPLCGTTTT
jgi:hypothetical protein